MPQRTVRRDTETATRLHRYRPFRRKPNGERGALLSLPGQYNTDFAFVKDYFFAAERHGNAPRALLQKYFRLFFVKPLDGTPPPLVIY
jgi:hypothetical protein